MGGEMVERVAKAIYETDPVGVRPWEDAPVSNRERCLMCVRVAIAAMREPTEGMVAAGEFGDPDDLLGLGNRDPDPAEIWRRMIDAALSDAG